MVWTGRAACEWVTAGRIATFATLTYDDASLPRASREDVDLLFEWLRDLYPLRYFLAPDSGDRFGRFHWHVLLYGVPYSPQLTEDLQNEWQLGFVHAAPVNPARIGYTCGYVTKKLNGDPCGRKNVSTRFGYDFLADHAEKLRISGTPLPRDLKAIKIGGKAYPAGKTQKDWWLKLSGHSARAIIDATIPDRIVCAATAPDIFETIRRERQLSGRGSTIGQPSKTQTLITSAMG
jgi:hypothetical protein